MLNFQCNLHKFYQNIWLDDEIWGKQLRIVTRLLLDCSPLILSSSNQGLLQDCNNSQIQFHLCPKMDVWIIPCKIRKSCHFKADLGFGLKNPKLTHFGFQKQKINNQKLVFVSVTEVLGGGGRERPVKQRVAGGAQGVHYALGSH